MSFDVVTTIDADNSEGASVWLNGVGPSLEIDFGDYRHKFAVCVIYKDSNDKYYGCAPFFGVPEGTELSLLRGTFSSSVASSS